MYDIVSIGSSVVDSFIKSKAFKLQKTDQGVLLCQTYGEKIDVDEYIVKTGGGGSNTAVGFSRMGFKTALVTELGKDIWADLIVQELKNEVVDSKLVVKEKNEKTGGSIILLGDDGGRTIMVHRGASAQLDPKDIPVSQISRSKWVHLSSISGQKDTLKFIFEVIRDDHTKMSWNPGNKELELLLSGEIDLKRLPVNILILNKHEWDSIREIQAQVLRAIPQILVTNGKHGGEVYLDGRAIFKFFSDSVETVDETGAGDSFAVGFVSEYLRGGELKDCLDLAKKNAVSVVRQVGAKAGLLKQ